MADGPETLDEWNAMLACNACCGMPACPVPIRVCESVSHTSTCADDDYTDAVAVWEAALADWLTELLDAWTEDRDAWLAEDPDREPEDYPVPLPDPRDPEDFPTPEPEEPAGYDDVIHGCFRPYARPGGFGDDDKIPFVYQHASAEFTNDLDGVAYFYIAYEVGGGVEFAEELVVSTYAGTSISSVQTRNLRDTTVPSCGPDSSFIVTLPAGPVGGWGDPAAVCDRGVDYHFSGEEIESETGYSRTPAISGTLVEGLPFETLALQGCSIDPWGDYEKAMWSLVNRTGDTYTLGSAIAESDLIDRALANLPDEMPEDPEGTSCTATTSTTWPVIRDLFIGADPEADPPEEGHYPTCDEQSEPASAPPSYATAMKVAYDWQVDPVLVYDESEPPEIVDWWRGDYFKITWQTCVFPKVWDDWKDLYDQWLIDKAIYDEWVAGGSIVPELPELPPENPTHPGVQPDPPTLSSDITAEWTGPIDKDDRETWKFPGGPYELISPGFPGRNAVVNVRFYCYPDSPFGYAPQIIGEGYEPFEEIPPPEDP